MSIGNRIYNFVDGYDSNGQSVYDIWKQAGNKSGKATDFIEFLNNGTPGEPGEQGPEGLPGKSAYDAWLAKVGNEGKAEEEFFNQPKKLIVMKDSNDECSYSISVVDGKLVYNLYTGFVFTPPSKTEYNLYEGENIFDPTGITITYYENGVVKENITDFSYNENLVEKQTEIQISFVCNGKTYTKSFDIKTLVFEDLLMDFTYTVEDGIYTLQTWKGTYKGEPSTKCIVPAYPNIAI